MTLAPGSSLGPYEIVAPLGAGGMGEVYRARDTRIGRGVAVKVLSGAFAADPDRLRRFEDEVRAAGSLNHPNVVTVFDVGTQDGSPYIVSELLDGQTLRERLSGGALPVRKAVDHAVQIAEGLAAAHAKGIVHRDLKPENVFITREGRVKILDFGLAKSAVAGSEADSATLSRHTDPGTVLGTVGYMSPEQVRARPADHRSDIFSFGAVLYEMLSGRRAFRGDTAADTMSAILREDPPELSAIPPALDRIVRRCLEKSPEERFESARDLAFDLANFSGASAPSVPAGAVAKAAVRRTALGRAVAAALLLGGGLALGYAIAARRPWAAGAPLSGVFTQLTDLPGAERGISLSPDGKTILFSSRISGNSDIYAQRVGGHNPIDLTRDSPDEDIEPAFSPDGEMIAFRSEREGGGIFYMGSTGESVRRLTDFGHNPSWSPDGKEVVVSTVGFNDPLRRTGNGQLWAVKVPGGDKRPIAPGALDALQPSWSPHGRRIAYWGLQPNRSQRDIWTVAADGSPASTAVPVTNDAAVDWSPVWSADDRFLYFLSGRGGVMNLWRVPIDEDGGRLLGPFEPLTGPAQYLDGISPSRNGGELAFATLDRRSSVIVVEFDPVRESVVGAPRPVLEGSRFIAFHDLSPDGQWVAFGGGNLKEDLFLVRTDGSGYRQLTDDDYRDRNPTWSPDGKRLVFYSDRTGDYNLWAIRPDGSGLERLSTIRLLIPKWSPDGTKVAATDLADTWIVDVAGPAKGSPPTALPRIEGRDYMFPTSWSPDGVLLAGTRLRPDSTPAGLYVYSFASGQYRKVADIGGQTSWLGDSRRLIFRSREGLVLFDTASGRMSQILPRPFPVEVGFTVAANVGVSKDERRISLVDTTFEGDVWMMALK
ncbi:MAG TPA: protein kinase [Chloroflexota bacterium]